MAISRYDTPAQASFMQTYAPVPFEELMQAGAVQQNRWEDSEATQMAMETEFGNIPALTHVTTSTGETLEVGNAKAVEAEVEKLRTSLNGLTEQFPNKASVEYRGALKGLVMDFRRAQASTGVFGRSKADVESYRAFEEDRKNAEIGSKFHRAIYSDQQLRQFAAGSQEGYTPFTGGGPILGDVNVQEELNKTMSKINDTILGGGNISQDEREAYMAQIRRTGFIEGISRDRALGVARDLISQNVELRTDLQAQAKSLGIEYEDLVESIANTTANAYTKQKGSVTWATDTLGVDAAKRAAEQGPILAANLNIPVQGKEYASLNDVATATVERKNVANTARETAIGTLTDMWGVPQEAISVNPTTGELSVNTKGIPKYDTGEAPNEVELGLIVQKANASIRQANKAVKDIERLKTNAMRQAGISEEQHRINSLQVQEDVMKRLVNSDGALTGIGRAKVSEHGSLDAALEAMAFDDLVKKDSRYKAVNTNLKRASESNTAGIRGVRVDEDFKDYMQSMITNYGVSEMSVEWSDIENGIGEVDESDKKKYIGNNPDNPPEFTGDVFMDPNDGRMKGMYRIFNKKGEEVGKAKMHLPEGGESYLYKAGLFDEFNTAVESKVYNQLDGILGINGVGTGVLELSNTFKPKILNSTLDGKVDVSIPVMNEDGTIEEVANTYNSVGDMVNHFGQLTKEAIRSEVEAELNRTRAAQPE